MIKKYTKGSALGLALVVVVGIFIILLNPPSAGAAACTHKNKSPLYSDAAHPHSTFYDCRDCYARLYTGGTTYKSNCSTCNPALNCKHTGSKWTDGVHPHPVYCQTCSAVVSYGYNSNCSSCNPCASGHSYGTTSYSSTHPHAGIRYCVRCGVSQSMGSTTLSSCTACNPCAKGHDFYAVYCDAEHPHKDYNYCRQGCKEYLGTTRYKSNCSICNPSLQCQHTAETWQDHQHPHTIYCRGCSAVLVPISTQANCSQCFPSGGSGSSSLTIYAATSLTSISDSGVLSVEYAKEVNDSFSFWAEVSGGDTLKSITCVGRGTAVGGSVAITNDTLGTYTITATTTKGATRTISVNVKTQSAAIGDIRFKTVGMNIKTITGPDGSMSKSGRIDLEGASIIPSKEFAKIASMIGRYDGKTYTLHGSLIIEVYNAKTSKSLGTYDVLSEFSALSGAFAWGQSTISDFRSMQVANVTYQAPKAINATATYCSQDRGTVFGMLSAQDMGAPEYIFPYETRTVTFSSGAVSPAGDWEYHGVQWQNTPSGSGSEVGGTSRTDTFTSEKSSGTYYFYWKEKVTTGSITVYVRGNSGESIPNATVSLGGKSGGSGTRFSDLTYGTYSVSAGASGYYSGSTSATISSTNRDVSVTVVLNAIPRPQAALSITPIVDGTYRSGSKVLVSAYIGSNVDLISTSPAQVTMSATYQKVSGSNYVNTTFSTQSKSVVIPGGDKNLVWFEITLPSGGYYSQNVNVSYIVNLPAGYDGDSKSASVNIPVVNPVTRETKNPTFEETPPASFLRLNRKTESAVAKAWTVWTYQSGGFVKQTYSAKMSPSSMLQPDETAGYSKYNASSGIWTTRSGYGINADLSVAVQSHAGMVVGTPKVDVYYPEHNYSTGSTSTDNLRLEGTQQVGSSEVHNFTFKSNVGSISKNKMHLIPIWYPNGEYSLNYSVYDIWTPVGELTASGYSTINIDGSMYDDSYAPPR